MWLSTFIFAFYLQMILGICFPWGRDRGWRGGGSPDFKAKRIPVFCQTRAELDTMSLKPGFMVCESSDLNIQVYILVSYPNCLKNTICILHIHTQTHVHLFVLAGMYISCHYPSARTLGALMIDPPSSTTAFCHAGSQDTLPHRT